jgi:hypothetical protein
MNKIKIVINQRSFDFTTELETKKSINLKKVSKSLSIYLDNRMKVSQQLKSIGLKKAKGSFIFSQSFNLSIFRNECLVLDSVKFNTNQSEKWKLNCKDKETFELALNIMFEEKTFAEIFEA